MKEGLVRFLNIRQGESVYVSYLLLHYFFQGVGIAVLFVVANTLFLSHFEIESLPLVFICSAVVLALLGKLNDSLSSRWPVPKMLMTIAIFVAFTVFLLFIGAITINAIWIPFVLYIWYQVVNLQIDTEFWSLSSFLFDVRQAKRLYGLISVGDVPAKLLGLLMVHFLAPLMGGVTSLLIISAVSFLAGTLVLKRLLVIIKPHHFAHHATEHATMTVRGIGLLARFFQSDLVMGLSILYLIGAVILNFVDFSFLSGVEHKFHSQKELSDFFEIVFAIGNGVIILCKLFFSGKAIERLGVKRSLLSLPLFLITLCITMVIIKNIFPGEYILMWFFTVMIVFSEVFRAVLYDPLFLALFQPLPAETRHKAHDIISGIINPIGLGICGVSLYIGISIYHHVDLYKIDYVLIVLLIVWIGFILYSVRKYIDALRSAINRRMIDSGQLNLGDEGSLKILKSRLTSPRPDEVIYASEILSKSHLPVFVAAIPDLLSNPIPEVRLYTLNTMQELRIRTDNEALYNLVVSDNSPDVCEAAVKLYCTLYEDIVSRITPVLDSPDPKLRAAGIKGFLKSGDLEPMMIGGQQLLKMLESKSKDDLLLALDIIGDLGFRNYYKPVLDLLGNKDHDVQKAAIIACGSIQNPKLIEPLFQLIDIKPLKKAAIDSLSRIGDPVLEYLIMPGFREKHEDESIKLYSRIGGQTVAQILISDYLPDALSGTLDEVLKALNRLNPDLKNYQSIISKKLDEELVYSFLCLKMISINSAAGDYELLTSALNHEVDNSKNRLFQLLGFIYDRNIVYKAKVACSSPDKEKRANAMEYLENDIDRDLKMKLFPLLEEIPLDQKLSALSKVFPQIADFAIHNLHFIILQQNNNPFLPWTKAVALYKCADQEGLETLDFYLHSQNKLLSECAAHCLKYHHSNTTHIHRKISSNMKHENIHGHTLHSEKESMLEIEKILILKSANMFAATPENILVGIAGIAREERKRKGENIFVKDDLGSCLYIICEGDISIHIDGKELSTLHSRDLFGELALLDPEPRSATATALNDCLLLRIDQAAFNELIEDRPEVAQGILTILSRRIRSQNDVIQELKAGDRR